MLEMPLSSRLNWKKIGYSDFAALYPIFPYHGERRQRIVLHVGQPQNTVFCRGQGEGHHSIDRK